MASDINSVFIIGRLTRDPEIKYTKSGTSVCSFSIANNYKYGDTEKVNFFNCVAWAKTGEVIAEYCKKGARIGIEGRLQQRSWDDQDGKKRQTVEIVVDNFQFLDSKTNKDAPDAGPPKQSEPPDNPFSDEDIPF
jgi:single-strand DNA-binding protein